MNDNVKSTGAIAFVVSGIAAAFALAACCAIPFALAAAGIGASWLIPIVSASQPHAEILTAFSLAALAASVIMVWRPPTSCRPNSLCSRRGFRWAISGLATVGAILLVLSKIYA